MSLRIDIKKLSEPQIAFYRRTMELSRSIAPLWQQREFLMEVLQHQVARMRKMASHRRESGQEEFLRIQYQIYNSELPILGLTSNMRMLIPVHGFIAESGSCLDPFAALLNHSCHPNAYWSSHCRKLCIRAEGDIAAGEELTISYCSLRHTPARVEKLKDSWCITCSCAICTSPCDHISEKLTAQIETLSVTNIVLVNPKQHLRATNAAIEAVQEAGWGYELSQMWDLMFARYCCQLLLGQHAPMLKSWLTMRYAVVPAARHPFPRSHEADSVRILTTLVDVELFELPEWRSYPMKVRALLRPIHTYLRAKLLRESVKFYGKDGTIALRDCKLDKSDCLREEYFNLLGIKRGFPAVYNVEVIRTKGKDAFVVNMNLLLEWAGVGKKSREELLS